MQYIDQTSNIYKAQEFIQDHDALYGVMYDNHVISFMYGSVPLQHATGGHMPADCVLGHFV